MVDHFTALDATLCVGSHPHAPEHFTELASQHGIRAVVSLQSDADLASRGLPWNMIWQLWTRLGVQATRVAITDFDQADLGRRLDDAVEAVAGYVAAGHRTYVHCNAGLNRSPSTIIAYLTLHRQMPLDAATAWVLERHRALPYQDVLARWARRHGLPLTSASPLS